MMMYAIALTMNGKAKSELTELRARFGTNINYSIEPHVTLSYPFTLKTDINVIENKLSEVAGQTKPFALILDGIRYWEGRNNVAYVAVQNQLSVFNLHVAVTRALQGLITGDTTYNLQNFTAHLTINEQIPGEALPNLKKELSRHEPTYRVKMTSLTLFEAEPNEKRETWKPTRIFRFLNSE
jgi:2'-5' RNA ligase